MSEELKRSGRCLCGGVTFEADLKAPEAHICHCGMCRRAGGGGPAIAIECDPDIRISGEQNLSWYRSSEEAERGFCKQCDSSLFYRLVDGHKPFFNLSVGTLDRAEDITVSSHIFIDSKPPYYDFADACPRLTEKEVLGLFEADSK